MIIIYKISKEKIELIKKFESEYVIHEESGIIEQIKENPELPLGRDPFISITENDEKNVC